MYSIYLVGIVLLHLVAPISLFAEVKWGAIPTSDVNLADLAIPDSPGFSVLGVSPQSTIRPATPRALAGTLLNGLDANGNFQTGVAVDFAPYMLLYGDSLTIGEYRSNWLQWWLANLQLSIATSTGLSSDDDSVRLGGGLRSMLWNRGDPRQDLTLQRCIEPPQMENFNSPEEFDEAYTKWTNTMGIDSATKCRTDFEARTWNSSALEVAAAPMLIQKQTPGKEDVSWGGATFWTSIAYGFEDLRPAPGEKTNWTNLAQVVLHSRYSIDQEVPISGEENAFQEEDNFIVGTSLRVGKPEFAVTMEGSYVRTDIKGKSDGIDDSYRVGVLSDVKLPFIDGLWLQPSVGATGGKRGDEQIYVLATIKWGNTTIDPVDLIGKLKSK